MLIDLFFLLLAGYGLYVGFNRGIVKTVLYILSIVIGFMVAVEFTPSATRLLERLFDQRSALLAFLAFLLCFGLTLVLFRMVANGIEKILKTVNINFLNKLAGGMIMAAVFTLGYSVLLWFATDAGLIGAKTGNDSLTYEYLREFPNSMRNLANDLKPVAEKSWDKTNDFIRDLNKAD